MLLVRLVVALLLLASAEAAAQSPRKLVVFGDSNVDTGNVYEAIRFPPPPNVEGRFSNGPIVVDYLARDLGLEVENYAHHAATTGRYNLIDDPEVHETGALSQIDTFSQSVEADSSFDDTVFLYWAGSNDLYTGRALDATIERALANIEEGMVALDDVGARRIIVANRTARPRLGGPDDAMGQAFNAALRAAVDDWNRRLDARVELFDAYGVLADMVTRPDAHGITHPTALCRSDRQCVQDRSVAAGYVNWDAAHKTTRAHERMAEVLAARIRRGDS